jgi:hypothetical protein
VVSQHKQGSGHVYNLVSSGVISIVGASVVLASSFTMHSHYCGFMFPVVVGHSRAKRSEYGVHNEAKSEPESEP